MDDNQNAINEGVFRQTRGNPCETCTCFLGGKYCGQSNCQRPESVPDGCVPRRVEGECCPSYDHCFERKCLFLTIS